MAADATRPGQGARADAAGREAPAAQADAPVTVPDAAATVPDAPAEAETRRVEKPWGHELIWALTDRYAGKILVMSGRLRLHHGSSAGSLTTTILGPGDHRHIPVGMVHRFEAIERCELIEVSTPELDDVIRLQDDFGREGTSAP